MHAEVEPETKAHERWPAEAPPCVVRMIHLRCIQRLLLACLTRLRRPSSNLWLFELEFSSHFYMMPKACTALSPQESQPQLGSHQAGHCVALVISSGRLLGHFKSLKMPAVVK